MKKRKDGRYEKKVTVGTKLDGTPIRRVFYGRTMKEVEQQIREFVQQGYQTVDRSITLKEWAKKWLETYIEDSVSDRTYKSTYAIPVDKHIIPYFKDAKLADVKAVDIQSFLNTKSAYSMSQIKKLKQALTAMFESAIQNDIVTKNPCRGVKIKSSAEPDAKAAYSAEETRRIIDFAKTHKHGPAIIMILKTGLRTGELLALKWSDINIADMTVSINKAVTLDDYAPVVSTPKTKSSIAEQPFDEETKKVLLAMPRPISGYLFTSTHALQSPKIWADGPYKRFMTDYAAYCEEHGFEYMTLNPHELRHTYGTLIYEATGDIYITSKLMRHANIDITVKTYVHETTQQRRDAVDKLSAIC